MIARFKTIEKAADCKDAINACFDEIQSKVDDMFKNNNDFSWQETWDEFNIPEGTENISRRIKNNYITLTPTLNIDIPLTRFFAIRVGSGYQITVSESWTIENDKTLRNVPSSLSGDAFFIQTGIYLGFFAY